MATRIRTSVVVVHNRKLLTFFAVDPHDGREFHFLPGGEIGDDETATEAAVRETQEETGFKITVDPSTALDVDYPFRWNGKDWDCLTIFYRGRLTTPFQTPEPVDDTSYNKGVVWVPIENIDEVFSYHTTIKNAVRALVEL